VKGKLKSRQKKGETTDTIRGKGGGEKNWASPYLPRWKRNYATNEKKETEPLWHTKGKTGWGGEGNDPCGPEKPVSRLGGGGRRVIQLGGGRRST